MNNIISVLPALGTTVTDKLKLLTLTPTRARSRETKAQRRLAVVANVRSKK